MADQNTCDLCGCLIIGDPVRYELKIRLYAGYDVLELTEEDLRKDLKGEMDELLRLMEGRDPEELEREVYEEFSFDLCSRCRKVYRKDPLYRSRLAKDAASAEEN